MRRMSKWLDPRNRAQCKMICAFIILLICVVVSIADAAVVTANESDWRWETWYAIQALVVYIYISGNNRTAASIAKLFELNAELNDKAITEDHHRQLDHSLLCPKCRR